MKNGRLQAKDIADHTVLEIIREVRHTPWPGGHDPPADGRWVLASDLESRIAAPWKVILAKMRSLESRGLVKGCTCGCRGDFELTDEGEAA